MSWLSSLFKGGKMEDPAAAASPYLNQIPGVGEKYYNPFIQGGATAGDRLGGEYDKLLDPTTFMNKLMEGYKPSEGYQFSKDQLERELGNTAAAGGIAGTPEHQRLIGEGVQGLLSKDMQQYLSNALGIYGTGLSGEQDFYNKGFQASGSLADLLAGNLGSQAGLAFQGAQQRNADKQAKQNSLLKFLSTALGAGAGFAFGGPAGGAVGAKAGSSVF